MTLLDALALGLVEGVTEFLPISSTGHLILASELLGLPPTEFLKSFEIAIQLGAILAVVMLYWRLLLKPEVLKKLAVAFIPTGAVGFALYPIVKNYFLGSVEVVLAALFAGGIALIVFELWRGKTDAAEAAAPAAERISYRHAFIIGLAQSLAVIPGVSRAGATILGGLLLGVPRTAIVEFSFLLAVPTMLAATGFDLLKSAASFAGSDFGVLALGFAVSFAAALMSIRLLLKFVAHHTFIPFGVYRIALAAAFFLLVVR